MNAELLLAHYDRISDAPDAVARLRKFVLDLAVRGKLVEPTQGRLFVSRLIREIKKETAERAEHGAKSPQLQFQEIAREDAPFRVPPSWTWIRFGCLVIGADAGWSPKAENFPRVGENWGVLKVSAVSWDRFLPSENKQLLPGIAPPEAAQVHKGDFLISRANTSELVAKSVVVEIEPKNLILSDKIVRLKISRSCNMKFLNMVNNHAGYARAYYAEEASGTSLSMKNVSRSVIYNLMVPLPSMEEQDRIIAKVDELMALCDRLEAAQREQETRREQLTASSHHHLNNGGDVEELRTHAQFFIGHFLRLTTRPDQIKQLRQTILHLGLSGKLVSQNRKETPASNLLATIAKKRAVLLQAGYPNDNEARTQSKKREALGLPDNLPSLPAGWQWSTLLQCSSLVVDCHNKTAPYSKTGTILLRTTNIRNGTINFNDPKFVDQRTYERWSARCIPEPGDILITREAPMGEVCIIPEGMTVCMGQRIMLIRIIPNTIDSKFLLYSLCDPLLMERVQDKPVGATVQHLRVGGVETLLVPVPPLAEQHRIVAKVDELMGLCDKLEASLSTAQTETSHLLESVLHHKLQASA